MNRLGKESVPFLFVIDFEQKMPFVIKLEEVDPRKILYFVNGRSNADMNNATRKAISLNKTPENIEQYMVKFNKVRKEIEVGNTYLINLTCSTPVLPDATLREIFIAGKAKYKLLIGNRCVCFSPESFIKINDGLIRSYPMKGTIDASLPDAESVILHDPKETAEHYTIVDLIRNDLNIVAKEVEVKRFRYVEKISTNGKDLLQVSSEICGILDNDHLSHLGDIVFSLLPAGSVSGAPKKRTCDIIAGTEGCDRGFYTGVFGIFDGKALDSGVMIRFIEKNHNGCCYRSGGGITAFSDPVSEYNEMTDKIYVPLA